MITNPPRRRVALAFPPGLAFIERLHHGIVDYARQHGGWSFTRVPELLGPSIGWLRHWPGDGAFVLITTAADARIARALPLPVVNLAGYLGDAGAPSVRVDHRATGRLAAEHLLQRRFRRFGFYGTLGKYYSEQRRVGFVETLAKAGDHCKILEVRDLASPQAHWTNRQEELVTWLGTLHPPVGILASTDLRASIVLDACASAGLRVPEDVALLGVDNDPVVCEFCNPPLSSVSRNDHEVGWQAAELLDRLMRGERAPAKPVLVAPDGVVERRSTQTLAIEDPEVAAVVKHIREHLHEPFGVERILEQSCLSRRRLEQRFKQSLGCTPYALISELRVTQAKRLLTDPEKRCLTEIAAACGFSELRRFRLVFQQVTKQTPAQFRRGIHKER